MPPATAVAGELARFLPAPFAARPDLLGADSDHRRAAMAFVQVSGLDALLDSDPLAAVDALTATVEDACAQTGVTLLDTDLARDGFRYFLTAGAPNTVEDPEGRLLRTLVDVVRAETGLSVRAGVASGQVFAGPVGAPFRRTFSVMGDTTNLAARLTGRAPAGRVLAHESVPRRSATVFATEPHDAVRVKGKAEPIPVVLVDDVLGQRGRRDAHRTFVGRDPELAGIADAVAAARDGAGSVVEIVGEPGLGKTRLALEGADASGLPVVRLTADPYGAHVPYRALATLLRPLLELSDRDDPGASGVRLHDVVARLAPDLLRWLPLLAPAIRSEVATTPSVEELDDRFRAARFHDALRRLLTALLPEPTVVLVDDAQWVDQTSADALAACFADLMGRPWAVLLTRRDDEAGLRGSASLSTTVVRLDPLAGRAARDLVGDTAGTGLRAAEVEAIVARAGGNPYFLLELATTGQSHLPDTIEELVGLRIDDLSGTDREMLRQAAVLGSRFPTALFERTSGLTGLPQAVTAPGLDGFLRLDDDGTVSFRREIHREVAYEQLTFRRRRDVHRRAALAIEAQPALAGAARLPLLSLHTFASGTWAEAYRWSQEAATEAKSQFANDEAAVFLRRAIESGRRADASADDLRELHLELAEALRMAGRLEDAAESLTRARRATHEPADLALVLDRIAHVRQWAGRFPATLRAAGELAEVSEGIPGPRGVELVVSATLLRAGVRFWQGKATDCKKLALEAVERAEALPAGQARTGLLAQAYALHDTAAIEIEGRAGRYGELPLEMYQQIGDLYSEGRFAVNVAVGDYYEGRWANAVALYRRSLDIAERIGDVFSVAVAEMNIGELLSLQGHSTEAVELLTASLNHLLALHTPQAAAHAACYLGHALKLAGDPDAAGERLTESATLFADTGITKGFSVDELSTRQVELLVARSEHDAACRAVDDLVDRATPLATNHRARVLRSRAVARRTLGTAGATDDLDQSLDLARRLPLGYEAALTLLVRADWTGSDSDRTEAAELLGRLGAAALLPH